MRILLDQSVHDHRNQGNNSLLAVTLKRFRNYWPDASYDVISNSPHLCKVYFPGTEPVKPESSQEFEDKLSIFHRLMPRRIWLYLFELREAVKSRKNSVANLTNSNSPILSQYQSEISDLTQGNDTDVDRQEILVIKLEGLSASPASTDWYIARFQSLINYCISNNIPIITMDDLYQLQSGPITIPIAN